MGAGLRKGAANGAGEQWGVGPTGGGVTVCGCGKGRGHPCEGGAYKGVANWGGVNRAGPRLAVWLWGGAGPQGRG